MAVFVPRTRTIGVRLSEEEYSSLERYCVESGARCISDLARTAIFRLVNRMNEESLSASAARTRFRRVHELEQKLARLTTELALLKAGIASVPADEARAAAEDFEEELF
ncbi:MAG: hypothetical protein ACLGPM_02595 [Acidobacteriota bacterium]